MNTKIITALLAAALLSSCASSYRATSTPDDVYYSSAPQAKVNSSGSDEYENYVSNSDDQYLRMKVQNNSLWSTIDDNDYWNDSRYDYGYSCDASRFALMSSFYNPFYNPYSFGMYSGFGYGFGGYGFGYGWTSWNSPYQTIVLYRSPKVYFANTGKSNITAYRNFQYNNNNGSRYINSYQNNNYSGRNYNSNSNSYNTPTPPRSFNVGSSNNNAGGRSGGFNSAGSSSGGSRPTHH